MRTSAATAMKRDVPGLLAELERFGAENDLREADRAKKMLNLDPDTARLLSILLRSSGARRVLEIGTSNGYSTIWLASAVAETGGQVISVERIAEKQAMARRNLESAGLLPYVSLILGDATDVVRELAGPFDWVFFDADRRSATEQLGILMPKLAPKVFVAADNALSHPQEISEYLKAVSGLGGFDHLVIPVGKGLSLAYRGAKSAA